MTITRQSTSRTVVSLAMLLCFIPLAVNAQNEPSVQPGVEPEPAPAPAVDPTVAPAPVDPVVAPAPAGETAPEKSITPTEVPLATEVAPPAQATETTPSPPPTLPPVQVNAWLRLGHRLQSFKDPEKMDKLTQTGEAVLLFSGQVTEQIGVTADFIGTYGPTPGGGDFQGSVAILDLIGRFDLHDLFHIWAGRMLVPSDRANFAGYWFASPWDYPGFFTPFQPPVGPRQGAYGRNNGVTVWGEAGGGMFKYYAGVFNLYDSAASPLYSGRLSLSVLDPEPGYYHANTYYGAKDVLAFGIGAQMQNDGSVEPVMPMAPPGMAPPPMTDDYSGVNADVLFEKKLGGAGVVTLEGAFYKYMGDFERVDHSYYVLASYLTPIKIGFGHIQPLVRLQQAKPESGATWMLFDAQIGYVIEAFAARLALGFQRSDAPLAPGAPPTKGNALYLGVQLQK